MRHSLKACQLLTIKVRCFLWIQFILGSPHGRHLATIIQQWTHYRVWVLHAVLGHQWMWFWSWNYPRRTTVELSLTYTQLEVNGWKNWSIFTWKHWMMNIMTFFCEETIPPGSTVSQLITCVLHHKFIWFSY